MSPTTIPGNLILQSPTANDPLLDLNTQPSLDLQFATSKTLNDRVSGQNLITFSRSTTGTYVDSNGIIQTAAIDAPRFDHDPTTNASLGLLVEESRTNFLPNSTNVSFNVFAGGTGAAPVVSAVTDQAPDGSTNSVQRVQLDRGTGNTINDLSIIGSSLSSLPSSLYSESVWLKSNDASTYVLIFYDAAGNKGDEITVTPSWKRYSLDASTSYKNSGPQLATGTTLNFGLRNDPGSVIYYTGINNSQTADILVWGLQIEAGAFPTSYIPTSGSSVPRAADVVSITGSNFSGWYEQSGGTVFCDFSPESTQNGTRWAVQFGNVATLGPNSFVVGKVAANLLYADARVSSVLQYSVSQAMTSSRGKIAYAVSDGNHQAAFDGTLAASGTGSFASLSDTILHIGKNVANTEILNGHISRLTYYPYRLPDATLQEITS